MKDKDKLWLGVLNLIARSLDIGPKRPGELKLEDLSWLLVLEAEGLFWQFSKTKERPLLREAVIVALFRSQAVSMDIIASLVAFLIMLNSFFMSFFEKLSAKVKTDSVPSKLIFFSQLVSQKEARVKSPCRRDMATELHFKECLE